MRILSIHSGTGNSPIVPRSITNPVGEAARINRTVKALSESLDSIHKWLVDRFEAIPTERLLVNSLFVHKYRYEYQIDVLRLEQLVNELLIQIGALPSDYVVSEVRGAYEVGTALAVENLANISEDYTREFTQVLISEPWQRRVALVGARTFEEMKGFEGDIGVELSRILREAVQDGLAPLQVKDSIAQRFGIAERRARKIAQTEITGALRRARWDEAQDANDRLGIKTRLMWISALKPTTRLWHAQRHGNLYSIQDVREFYAVDGNAINCFCSSVECLVDDEGKPVTPRVVDRLEKQKAKYFGKSTD